MTLDYEALKAAHARLAALAEEELVKCQILMDKAETDPDVTRVMRDHLHAEGARHDAAHDAYIHAAGVLGAVLF
jgi:hypothetical protein